VKHPTNFKVGNAVKEITTYRHSWMEWVTTVRNYKFTGRSIWAEVGGERTRRRRKEDFEAGSGIKLPKMIK